MPPVLLIQDDPAALAAATATMPSPLCDWPLPPVIITEKGESLDEFVARSTPDFFTALQVCAGSQQLLYRNIRIQTLKLQPDTS